MENHHCSWPKKSLGWSTKLSRRYMAGWRRRPERSGETMLFYVQMKWNRHDLSFDEMMRLEALETTHAAETIASKMVVGIWKVASQHRIIAIVDVQSADELDHNSMFGLP